MDRLGLRPDTTLHTIGTFGVQVSPSEALAALRTEAPLRADASAASRFLARLHNFFERDFITTHDGFAAYDADGRIYGGVDPSAVEHAMPRFGSVLDALSHILAPKEGGIAMNFSANGQAFPASPTGREDEKGVSLAGGLGASLLRTIVDPKKGGLASVSIKPVASDKTANNVAGAANILMLPRDYSGPVFIVDIDDTIRATNPLDVLDPDRAKKSELGGPIAGAKEILEGVAALGIPIVYLSAGPTAIHTENEEFLKQFPQGILLDNQDWHLSLRELSNHDSAIDQAAYKRAVLERIKATFPNAKLFGIGDDKYGDAMAYTETGVRAWIHDVKPDHANVPGDFTGQLTPNYSRSMIDQLLDELRNALIR
jgi:hypothetical protein